MLMKKRCFINDRQLCYCCQICLCNKYHNFHSKRIKYTSNYQKFHQDSKNHVCFGVTIKKEKLQLKKYADTQLHIGINKNGTPQKKIAIYATCLSKLFFFV